MSRLKELKEAKSLSDLAKLLGYKPKAVSYILYIIPENNKYIEFKIPKKKWRKTPNKSTYRKIKEVAKTFS